MDGGGSSGWWWEGWPAWGVRAVFLSAVDAVSLSGMAGKLLATGRGGMAETGDRDVEKRYCV